MILVITIVGALGTLGYVIAKLRVGKRFTEFYILGLEGKAMDYPREMVVNEEGVASMPSDLVILPIDRGTNLGKERGTERWGTTTTMVMLGSLPSLFP